MGALHRVAMVAATSLVAVCLHSQAVAVDQVRAGVADTSFTFTDPSFGNLPNGQTHAHDVLVSYLGWQYLTYWDFDRRLAVARRELPNGAWQIAAFEDYRIPGEDSHNAAVIGISRNDGTIHLSFDHHGDDLNYRVSLAGVALTPEAFSWGPELFGAVTDTLDPDHGPVTRLTYPRFIPTPGGDLQFVYREISSGDGRSRMVDYRSDVGSWSNDRIFIERTGGHSDPLGGDSFSRNPYFNRIDYDAQGTLHATWTWRERAPIPYNRDIAYAYSEDEGVSWFNSDDELVADTQTGEMITASTPGINFVELGAEWGLMNNQGHVVDASGRVHVVMYHKDEPDDVVSYGNTQDSHYRHFWRAADGTWSDSWLPNIGNRPKLFSDADDNLVLAYKSTSNELAFDVATAASGYRDWERSWSGGADFGSSAQGDQALWDEDGTLSIMMQLRPQEVGEVTPLGVIDARFVVQEIVPDYTLEAVADAHVRAGVHADTNFGASTTIEVKENAGEDFDRIGYFRFDLSALPQGVSIERAELHAALASMGESGSTTALSVHRVRDSDWDELVVTWNSRPEVEESLDSHFGREAMSWNVTSAVVEALGEGNFVSFAASSRREGAPRSVNLRSRETTQAGLRPRLLLFLPAGS